jgi:hypothetical protein
VVKAYYDKKAGRFPSAAHDLTAAAVAAPNETPADAMAAAAAELATNHPGARPTAAPSAPSQQQPAATQPQQQAIVPQQPKQRNER